MEIFNGAFGLDQAIAGGIGAAIKFGIQRGLFATEAGMGSSPTQPQHQMYLTLSNKDLFKR